MLFDIAAKVRESIAGRDRDDWEQEICSRLAITNRPPHLFRDTLKGDRLKYIFEIKKSSPSTNGSPLAIDVAEMARLYQRCGADCISVLTEENYFSGSLSDLSHVRAAVEAPLLRKDFIIDSLQISEAKAYGADAALLIVALLTDAQLREFIAQTRSLQMDALVEVHSDSELARGLDSGAEIIGVNNRDLTTMAIDLQTGVRLLKQIPDHCIRVAESGISKREDAVMMQEAGADAVLIGTSVIRANDIPAKIRELIIP